MKNSKLICFVFLLLACNCFAQMRQDHVSFYSGDQSGESYGSFVKTDNNGNYFVAGRSNGYGTKLDYAIVKYSSAGEIIWERRYNGAVNGNDEPFGLIVDAAGNSYITGSSQYPSNKKLYECVTIKYNPVGKTEWINVYRNSSNINAHGHSMTMDQEGNVYLAGYTGNDESKDVLLMKINRNGETVWTSSYDANSFSADYTNNISIYKDHLYVCGGELGDGTFLDYLVLKFDVNGNLLWHRSHNGTSNGLDIARAIFVDKNEDVYVTGYTENKDTKLDITTIKYNSDGDQLWVTDHNGTGDGFDWPNHVMVDDFGNVYVEGGTQNERETDPECHAELGKCRNDATLIKYLPSGNIDWIRLYNGPDNMYDCLQGMTLDKDNNIYVGGRSHSSESGTNDDIITMKYNSRGAMLWFMKYNSGTGKNDYGNAIAVDNTGNVFTSGFSDARGAYDFVVVKYSPSDVSDAPVQKTDLNNYPNPFNPSTKISFDLSQSSFVTLKIYDVTGREILTMVNEKLSAGDHSYTFDAAKLNSGVYFYKLETTGDDGNKLLMTRKMMLVK